MVGFKPTDVPPTVAVKFVGAGTAACIADLFTFPLDTANVRLQIQGESKSLSSHSRAAQYRDVFGPISTMVKTEVPNSLYNGRVAGLQCQMSFGSVQIGLYDSVKKFYTKWSEHVGIGSRLLARCTTGTLAVAIAQPTDMVKVRFQVQKNVTSASRRYKGTMDAYKTIAWEEGMKGLWKGAAPCHFTSAFGAGFCTTVIASPVDLVKTRYMNSAPGQYGSTLNYALTEVRKGRTLAFYKGLMPSFLLLGS
ncbi:dicarboxylate carrier UCP2-like [Lissotriton helveticus]